MDKTKVKIKKDFKKVTITLPIDLVEVYQRFCEKEGMNLSSRIAVLLKRDLEK